MQKTYLDPMSPLGVPGEIRAREVADAGVRSVMAPVDYTLTAPATRAEYEAERDALLAELPNLKGSLRAKADFKLRVLAREIQRALDKEEADRKHAERVVERKKMQGGNMSMAALTMCELKALVKSAGATVAALVAPVVKKKGTLQDWIRDVWDPQQKQRALDMLASGDPQQIARALAARSGAPVVPAETVTRPQAGHSASDCCSGKILCANCRAKKEAAFA